MHGRHRLSTHLCTVAGTKVIARTSICSTGIECWRLGLPNEERFRGAGVYYGAGASEALLTDGQDVYIVGGGNSAGQAAMHLAPFARSISIIIRRDSLKSTLSQYLLDRIHSAPNIEVVPRTEVTGLEGVQMLKSIALTNRISGRTHWCKTSWLFVCIGGLPNTQWAMDAHIMRDEAGYLITGPDLLRRGQPPDNWPLDRDPYYLETNVPGVFAAGDVRHGSVKRFASAVGEGAMAVTFVNRILTSL